MYTLKSRRSTDGQVSGHLDGGGASTVGATVSVGKAAARKLTHARILLLADTSQGHGHADDDIVAALGTSLRTVERVRKRLVTEGFQRPWTTGPSPPRPDKIKIKGDVEQKLVRLACSDPPEGRCHWTLQLLADELVALGLVDDGQHARPCGRL